MKKTYKKPFVEKVEFKYAEQMVVASTTIKCTTKWTNENIPCATQKVFSSITPNA